VIEFLRAGPKHRYPRRFYQASGGYGRAIAQLMVGLDPEGEAAS
jgi:hypothetical protein